MVGTILIIDDEEQLRKLLKRIIGLEGFAIEEASSLKQAGDILNRKAIDVVLCDVKLPDGNGVDFVGEIKSKHPLLEVISLTAYGNIADGVRAIKNGGFDYITKGDDNDRIIPLVYQAMEKVLKQKKASVKISEQARYSFSDIVGESKIIRNAIALAAKIAPTDANVLLLGETGTGKEVFANAIHGASKRNTKPFIAINCSAFTRELLEGELFGHLAGAYTGANKDKQGLIELAHQGTLFLDEIGEMNIDLQAKLLRVIENKEFIKLGDIKTTRVDVRIIAATNRDLSKSITEGSFREDLYYRLNVFTIELPSLKQRPEDILPLCMNLLARESGGKSDWQIHPASLKLLREHSWRGNIRELRNVLARAVILAEDSEILPEHLPYEIQTGDKSVSTTLTLASVEKAHIERVLTFTHGNKTKAAEYLGIGLTTLYRKLQEYGISY